jgi:hypothetical protein
LRRRTGEQRIGRCWRRRRRVLPHNHPLYAYSSQPPPCTPTASGRSTRPGQACTGAAHRPRLTDDDVAEPECPTDVDTSTRPASTARLLSEAADSQSAAEIPPPSGSTRPGRLRPARQADPEGRQLGPGPLPSPRCAAGHPAPQDARGRVSPLPLGQWVAVEDAWLPDGAWQACADPMDRSFPRDCTPWSPPP